MMRMLRRARCATAGSTLTGGTTTTPRSPFEVHRPGRFVDVGGYSVRLNRGGRGVYRARTAGNRASRGRWTGVFRLRATIRRSGRVIDRCSVRTRWRVSRVG